MMVFSPTHRAVSRKEMAKEGLAGYVVPSTDAHQVAIESILEMAMLSRWQSKLVFFMRQSILRRFKDIVLMCLFHKDFTKRSIFLHEF